MTPWPVNPCCHASVAPICAVLRSSVKDRRPSSQILPFPAAGVRTLLTRSLHVRAAVLFGTRTAATPRSPSSRVRRVPLSVGAGFSPRA
ncbi:hypothetical protein [Nonomuraea sp. NPDC049607]|uniref:hypothetical protein n=1 Tax=Nonomuraea sp. NPDC049607 TaxID=3154732 RepID=UPI0034226215